MESVKIIGMSTGGAPTESIDLQTFTSRTKHPDAGLRARKRIWTALVCFCALVLAACGADVNSQLELDGDFSGTRVFVLTMAEADVEELSGGLDAASQALEAHTPDMLTFEGIEQQEEGYSATFTMSFSDLEDYQHKINDLLDASAVSMADRDMTIELDEQPLISRLSVQEDFYNDDLMGWSADALTREGVVADDATVLTSSGTATVILDGEEIETSTSLPRMNFTLSRDHRFQDVGLNVEFLETGEIRIIMAYLISAESAALQNEFLTQQVEQLNDLEELAESVADSGTTDSAEGGAGENRQISALFSTPEAVDAGMKILLTNDDASFEVQETSEEDSPDVITRYSGSNWTCEHICNPANLQQLDGETTFPEQWKVVNEQRGEGKFFVEFNRGMPLQQMTAVTSLGFDGSMEQTFEFVVDNATVEGHEETVTARFAPPPNTGSFHSAVESDKTVYTTTFQAQNAQGLTTMLNDYLKDKGVEAAALIDHEPINGIWADYDVRVDISPIWDVVSGGVEETATFSVQLPAMHSGHTQESASNERTVLIEDSTGRFTIHANGPTVTTLWVAVLTIFFLIVIVVLLFRMRRAATRVWGVAPADPEERKPYNVQGPKDRLTETEIFEAPLVPGAQDQSTTETPRRREATKQLEHPGPFPDIPTPSHTQYLELQNRLRRKRQERKPVEPEPDSMDSPQDDDAEEKSDNSEESQ